MAVRFLRETGRDPLYKIWHRSEDALLLYVHTGEGHAVARDRMLPLRAGTLALIGGSVDHYTVPADPSVYDRSKLFVDQKTLSVLLSLLPGDSPLHEFADPTAFISAELNERDQKEVARLFSQAEAAAACPAEGDATRLAALLPLLVCLGRGKHEPSSSTPTPLSEALRYIHHHISKPLTIEEICRAAHMSKFHFCRIFRERLGLTVMDYVLRTRLLQAKTMLRTSTLSVREISESCGFSSLSYFSRVFREREGKTPLALRREK